MSDNDIDLGSLSDAWGMLANGKKAMIMANGGSIAPTYAPFGMLRTATDDGLKTGNSNMVGDYSSVNKEFFIEAQEGERLAVRRAIVHMYATSLDISPGTYCNVTALTNGIILFWDKIISESHVILDVLNGDRIKKQEDWGKECYDARPVGPYGPTSKTPFWQVRFTFSRFVDPVYGIILEEGERLGVRLQDDFTEGGTDPIAEHYITFEGSHLGTPNSNWQTVLSPLA